MPTYVGKRVSGASLQSAMFEFQQKVLPDAFYATLSDGFRRGTYVWGYANGQLNGAATPQWPGASLEVHRGTPVTVKFVNDLPTSSNLRKLLTVDQTIHWANPLNAAMSFQPYTGPLPAVVHLHGGEDQSTSDGVPEGWFTNTGLHGKGYSTLAPDRAQLRDLPLPERPAGDDAVVPRPRAGHYPPQRLLRPRRLLPHPRPVRHRPGE